MTENVIQPAEIIILTIIPDVEFNAVLEQLSKKFHVMSNERLQDGSRYISIRNKHGLLLNIAVLKIYHPGNLNACLSTISGLHRFKPCFAFLCGISGNMAPDKRQLGDVVVSEHTSFLTYTRMCEGEKLQKTWPHIPQLDSVGKNMARRFLEDAFGLDFLATNEHTFEATKSLARKPKMSFGKTFCWDLVLDCGTTRRNLLEIDSDFAIVEMESAGFFIALDFYRQQFGHPVCGFIFRGISDHAEKKQQSDSEKANWRGFASANAARALAEFIDQIGENDFRLVNSA